MTAEVQAPPPGLPAVVRLNADPLNWPQLPRAIKTKLRQLRRARDDAWLVWKTISTEREEAWNGKRAAEARLKALTGARPDSQRFYHIQHSSLHRLADDHPEVLAQLQNLEDAKSNVSRLGPIVDACAHHFEQLSRLVSSVESYLPMCWAGLARSLHS
jgi:hypothetical protein